MLDWLWAGLLGSGFLWSALAGQPDQATNALFTEAVKGLRAGIDLMALIAVWFGLSRVAEKTGLLPALAALVVPLLRPLFPEIPRDHPAFRAMGMNVLANFLGLANAATPFGLLAMRHLQSLNPRPHQATPAMITFLALNSTTVSLVPGTALAIRAASGAAHPTDIVLPAAVATACAAAVALTADRLARRLLGRRGG